MSWMLVDADRWRQVEEVLDAALATDPSLWPDVLEARCKDDPELRQQVEVLLGRLADARTYLESAPSGFAAALLADVSALEDTRAEGRRIGAFQVIREIGSGGMSRVFLAARADGAYQQLVAVKLLRPGFDSDMEQSRLRAERQILATLNHPNIARLFDGGVIDGWPYLVLEYVDGEPIDRYLESGLSTRQRLELFLTVADAVHYAHNHGVVHRDIKPSNILVSADGTVKLLDFGIAKLLEDDVTGEAHPTRTRHRWLTPEYAAPEQVLGAAITTRTDVYQLGALLYELLTGRQPFAERAHTMHELEMAALQLEPGPFPVPLRGDLEAIVLKALRKPADERYAAASDFADDIRRYLAGLPVRARKRTVWYRTRRFVSRNRKLVGPIAVAAGLAAVAAGLTIERLRLRNADRQDRSIRSLLALVDTSATRGPFDTARVHRVIERGLARARELSGEPKARVLEATGQLQNRIGQYDRAFQLVQQALVIRRSLNDEPQTNPTSVPNGLLFKRPGDVYMMDENGNHEVNITNSAEAWNDAPAWAPDGRRVLISRAVAGVRAIYMLNVDGTGMTQLTVPPPGWHDAAAIALGDQVAFVRVHSGRNIFSIYRVNIDGTGLTQLTSGMHDMDPAPSPKADFLAFKRENDFYVLDLLHGGLKRLTHTPHQYKAIGGVSPDGKKIAFTRIDPGRLEQIFVMNIDGANTTRVSRGDFYDFIPRWSPDGKRIAFTSLRDGTLGVYSMSADGTDVVDLSRTPAQMAMRPNVNLVNLSETLWAWMKY